MVCTETFQALFGGRGSEENPGKGASGRSRDQAGAGKNVENQGTGFRNTEAKAINRSATTKPTPTATTSAIRSKGGGGIDKFVVPKPSPYVPDWAAFGREDHENGIMKTGVLSASTGDLEEEVCLGLDGAECS